MNTLFAAREPLSDRIHALPPFGGDLQGDNK
jgi:hypothetical protein